MQAVPRGTRTCFREPIQPTTCVDSGTARQVVQRGAPHGARSCFREHAPPWTTRALMRHAKGLRQVVPRGTRSRHQGACVEARSINWREPRRPSRWLPHRPTPTREHASSSSRSTWNTLTHPRTRSAGRTVPRTMRITVPQGCLIHRRVPRGTRPCLHAPFQRSPRAAHRVPARCDKSSTSGRSTWNTRVLPRSNSSQRIARFASPGA